MLIEPATFNIDGRFMTRWSADDKRVIFQAKQTLSSELKGKLRQQLHPSAESIKRLSNRYRWLYEQRANLMVLAVCGSLVLLALEWVAG